MTRHGRLAALAGAAALVACGAVNKALLCPCTSAPRRIEVRFLGVAGFLIKRGPQALLTAPLFTNPGWLEVGVGRIAPDPRRVAQGLERARVSPLELAQVRAILVGHAHYDHLLDVPALCPYTPQATVYGSQTVAHLLAADTGFEPCAAVRSVDSHAVGYRDAQPERQWIELLPDAGQGAVRMLALRSEHSAQAVLRPLGRFNLWEGGLQEDQPRLPEKASGWPQGQPYAYLIDFLDPQSRVVFRIHYSDSASCAPCGYVPEQLADGRPVDLVILTAGGSQSMSDYPGGLLENACARRVLIGHWESFFAPYRGAERLRPLPGAEALLAKARAAGFADACLPLPGSSFFFEPAAEPLPRCAFMAQQRARHCGCRVEGDGSCEP